MSRRVILGRVKAPPKAVEKPKKVKKEKES